MNVSSCAPAQKGKVGGAAPHRARDDESGANFSRGRKEVSFCRSANGLRRTLRSSLPKFLYSYGDGPNAPKVVTRCFLRVHP